MSKRSIKEAINKMLENYEPQQREKVKLITEQIYNIAYRMEEIEKEAKYTKQEFLLPEYRLLQNELAKLRSNYTTALDKLNKFLPEAQIEFDDGGLNEFA